MRTMIIVSAFAAMAGAAPRPQSIDFTQADAAGAPEPVTPPVDVTSASVSVQAAAAAATVAAAAVSASPLAQRDFWDVVQLQKRDGDCAAQPSGTGPSVNTPSDTPDAFLAYQSFADAANDATTPYGYSSAFTNLQGSSQISSYLGITTLSSYNPALCASYCDQLPECQAFNLYFERDPSQDPNETDCPNPPSLTNIKCVRWGLSVSEGTATNTGQWRDDFEVVIAGSNGYNKNAPPPSYPDYAGPIELDGAINAPNDPVTGDNTYMGYKFFAFSDSYEDGTVQYYNPEVCTAACTSQTEYNAQYPPATGNPQVCNQVVAYVLSNDGVPQGMYCALYTEEWAPNYATNVGQYRGDDYWSVSDAYAYVLQSYADNFQPICDVGGCPGGSYSGGSCGGYGQETDGTCC